MSVSGPLPGFYRAKLGVIRSQLFTEERDEFWLSVRAVRCFANRRCCAESVGWRPWSGCFFFFLRDHSDVSSSAASKVVLHMLQRVADGCVGQGSIHSLRTSALELGFTCVLLMVLGLEKVFLRFGCSVVLGSFLGRCFPSLEIQNCP